MPLNNLNDSLELFRPDEDETGGSLQFGQLVRLVERHPSAVALLDGRRIIFANRRWRAAFKGQAVGDLARGGYLESPALKTDPRRRLRIDSGGEPMPPESWETSVRLAGAPKFFKFFCIALGCLEGRCFSAVAAFPREEEIDVRKWPFAEPRPVDLNLLSLPVAIFAIADGSFLKANEQSLGLMGLSGQDQLIGPGGLSLAPEPRWEQLASHLFIRGRVDEASVSLRRAGRPPVEITASFTAFNCNGLAACLGVVSRVTPCLRPNKAAAVGGQAFLPPPDGEKGPPEAGKPFRRGLPFHPRLLQLNFSLSGQLVYVNEYARKMLARYWILPTQAAFGESPPSYAFPDDLAASFIRLASDYQTPPRRESEIIGPDGQTVHIVWTVLGVFNEPGRPAEIAVVGCDNTQTRQAADERAAALIRAQEALTAKEAILGRFTLAAREPLNVLLSFLELIANPGLLDDPQSYLLLVRQAILTMNNLIHGLRDSELDSLDSEPFQLDALLLEVLELVQAKAGAPKALLSHWLQPGTPIRLIGDAARLKQILWHLLDNAARCASAGRVSLSVRRLAEKEPGRLVHLMFKISDTGVGLSPDQIETCFRPLAANGRRPVRPEGGGLGLGLWLCRRLCALMGGDLRVESAPGLGSTFFFSAEFKRQDDSRPEPPADWLNPERRGHGGEKPGTAGVLLIERQPRIIASLNVLLEAAGMAVTVAKEADDAFLALERAMIKEAPFQLIIIGSRLKNVSDCDLVRRIRDSSPGAAPPVIIIGDAREPWFLDQGRPDFPFYAPHRYLPAGFMKSVRALLLANALQYFEVDQQPLNLLVSAEMRPESILENQLKSALLKKGHQVFVAQNGRWAWDDLPERPLNLFLMGLPAGPDCLNGRRPPGWPEEPENLLPVLAAANLRENNLPRPQLDENTLKDAPARRLFDLIRQLALTRTEPAAPEPANALKPAALAASFSADGGPAAVLDEDDVLKRTGGDRELLAVLAVMMQDSLSETMAKIQRAAISGDHDELRFQAHFLRGAASNMSARAVAAKAFNLEVLPWPCSQGDLRAALKALEDEVERLRPALEKLAVRHQLSPERSDRGE